MRNRTSPTRESIADHLVTARRCLERLGVVWRPGLATEAFVRKLISKGLLEPLEGGRMHPLSYHAFLKIIHWKSRKVFSWHAWRIGLWLRGTYFPISAVRESLGLLLDRVRRIALKDIAPTGRWTERFHEKYQRRTAHIRDQLIAPEFAGLMEPFVAAFLGKNVQETAPDIIASVAEIYKELPPDGPVSKEEASLLFEMIHRRMKEGTSLNLEEQQYLGDAVCRLAGRLVGAEHAQSFAASIMSDMANAMFAQKKGEVRFDFTLDDLIAGVATASNHDLLRARNVVKNIVCGRMTRAVGDLPSEARALPIVSFLGHTQPAMLRAATRSSPLFGAIIAANTLRGLRVLDEPLPPQRQSP